MLKPSFWSKDAWFGKALLSSTWRLHVNVFSAAFSWNEKMALKKFIIAAYLFKYVRILPRETTMKVDMSCTKTSFNATTFLLLLLMLMKKTLAAL